MKKLILKRSLLTTNNQEIPLYNKVANLIEQHINAGTLKPDDSLPSSREMAEQLQISRKTAVKAIDQLLLKGILYSKDRVGVFVARQNAHTVQRSNLNAKQTSALANANASKGTDESCVKRHIVVNDGFPDTSLIPYREFSRTYRQIFNRMAIWQMLGYNDPMGYYKFRDLLSELIEKELGLCAYADDICLVRGSQMALFLVANALLAPGDHIAIESPGYDNAYTTFERARLNIYNIPVDKNGIDVNKIEELCKIVNLNAIYVTPRHQYPTTATLTMARRQKLRSLSLKYGFIIIEDDFGCQYNFTNRHLPPLSAMLPNTHYIYIGTYSKIFAPGTRIGYMTSSREIMQSIKQYRSLIDIQGDTITERALYELYQSGDIQRHIRRSSKIYKERLTFATREIKRILGPLVNYKQPHGGLAIWIEIATKTISAENLKKHFDKHGINISVYTKHDTSVGIRIGYASIKAEQLTEVLECLSSFLRKNPNNQHD